MRLLAAALLVLAAMTSTAGQTSETPAVEFEAASIKLNRSGDVVAGLRRSPGGRFEVTNMPLAFLIEFAYQLQNFELQGGPSWMSSDRWDIIAKMAGDPPPMTPGTGTPDAIMLATRTLMAERFKLAVHRETREVDVYQLVRANADGRIGPGLRQATVDCLAIQKAADAAAKGDRLACGLRISIGRIQMGGRSMTLLLNALTAITQRRVVDRTGLTGDWELDITFNPPTLPPGLVGPPPPPNPDVASLFTVLQEQLGLKLEPARTPMPVMVVDSVEQPVED